MQAYLGIDVGSVSTNVTVLDDKAVVRDTLYIRTQGRPIEAVQTGLRQIYERNSNLTIRGVGTTGSARALTGVVVGADSVKNEITAHAVAAMHLVPDVQTVLEIGGRTPRSLFFVTVL